MFRAFIILSIFLLVAQEHFKRVKADSYEDDLSGKELYENIFKKEVEKLEKMINGPAKRSDVDSRIMEWQAKIDLVKALKRMPAGHGKFNFEEIGK